MHYVYLFIYFLPGLPYALNQAGLPCGLLLLIAVGYITGEYIDYENGDTWVYQMSKLLTWCLHFMADYSIILLIKGGILSGTNSYQSLVQSTFGYPGFLILSALQFLYPFIGELFKANAIIQSWILLWCILHFMCNFQCGRTWIFNSTFTISVLFLLTFDSVYYTADMNNIMMLHLCFLPQLWLATTSQLVTHWPKYFREYQEVCCTSDRSQTTPHLQYI